MPRRILIAIVLVLGATPVLLLETTAQANYYGPSNGDGCCWFPDNREHTFFFVDTGNQTYVDAMNHAFDHLDNGTNMTTKKVDRTSVTDVLFFARDYGTCCSNGTYDCTAWNGAGECEQAEVRLNRENLDGEGQQNKNKTACHETGHSTGLDHSFAIESCMEQGLNEPQYMSEHDKDHINGRYQ